MRKKKILEIILLNFLFITLIGLLRFYYFFVMVEQDSEKNIFLFSTLTTIALISFAIFLAYIAKNFTDVKNKKQFIKFIWPYYLFAVLNIDISIVPLILPIYSIFYFTPTTGIDVTIFSILLRLAFSIPIIFIPSYLIFKSKKQLKILDSTIQKYNHHIYWLIPIFIIFISIFSFGSLVFALNPVCAVKTIPTDDATGDLCFIPLATLTGNVDYCNTAFYYGGDKCLKPVAKIKNDPSICNNLIYKSDLLRVNEYTCLTQFFDKEDGYKSCDIFKTEDTGFMYECIETFVGWKLGKNTQPDENYYIYLINICNDIPHGTMSSCAVAKNEYEHIFRLERSKNDTIRLFKKYKEILKYPIKFNNEILNPKDIDFCKITSLLVIDPITRKSGTIYDSDDYYYYDENPYKVLCYGNFGKNLKAERYCNNMTGEDPNHSLKMVCQGGIYFNKYRGFYNFSHEGDMTSPYAQGYSIGNPPFQMGFGATAGNTDFNLSAYMNTPVIMVKDKWSDRVNIEIAGTYVDGYYKMKNLAENLPDIKFCDNIKAFKKECKEIVETGYEKQ